MVQTRQSKKGATAQKTRKKKVSPTQKLTKRSAGALAPHLQLRTATAGSANKRAVTKIQHVSNHKGITVLLHGEPYDGDHDRFCSRCHDGNSSRGCDFCPRSFCSSCVIPASHPIPEVFRCPHCHRFGVGEKGKVNKDPYTNGFSYVGELSTRENWTRCRSEPLIMISARLEGMPLFGSAAALIYHHLYTYLLGNIALVDFGANLVELTAEFNQRLERFRNGRFLVILMDHSSPDTGDVHIAPNNAGATTLRELFDFFLDGGLRDILKNGQQNTLVLHSCGGVVAHSEPLEYLKRLTTPADDESALFLQIIAFSQQNLQLAFTNNFLCDYAQNYFIHDKVHVGATIFEHQTLGPHTDVVLFKAATLTRFFWAHPVLRPHGKTAPTMCNTCKCFMPWIDADGKKRKSGNIKDH
ncbi:hypothetical protein M413DRAFT_447419, partial [Hebeloma cylindrosporum]